MTGNDLEVAKIMKMEVYELLHYLTCHPEYMTDSYYHAFGDAIDKRADQLIRLRQDELNHLLEWSKYEGCGS